MIMVKDDKALTAFLKALILLSYISISTNALRDDIDCLKAIKNSLKDPLNSLSSWNFDNYTEGFICKFTGIECWHLDENKVLNIHLSGMKLEGEFPSGLINCTSLLGISFSNNNLYGSIPSNIARIVRYATWLDISSNNFSGTIPADLANCTYLNGLKLDNNQFSGQIPPELGLLGRLNTFSVANNRLSGPVPSFNNAYATISADNYVNNSGLCGNPLPLCIDGGSESSDPSFILGVAIGGGTVGVLALCLVIFFVIRRVSRKRTVL